jgi:hypothetical protein
VGPPHKPQIGFWDLFLHSQVFETTLKPLPTTNVVSSRHGDAAGGFVVSVELLRDVRQGERLSISYAPSEAHTRERRRVYVYLPPLTTALAPRKGLVGRDGSCVAQARNHTEGLSHGVRGLWCGTGCARPSSSTAAVPAAPTRPRQAWSWAASCAHSAGQRRSLAHHQSRLEGGRWRCPCR